MQKKILISIFSLILMSNFASTLIGPGFNCEISGKIENITIEPELREKCSQTSSSPCIAQPGPDYLPERYEIDLIITEMYPKECEKFIKINESLIYLIEKKENNSYIIESKNQYIDFGLDAENYIRYNDYIIKEIPSRIEELKERYNKNYPENRNSINSKISEEEILEQYKTKENVEKGYDQGKDTGTKSIYRNILDWFKSLFN